MGFFSRLSPLGFFSRFYATACVGMHPINTDTFIYKIKESHITAFNTLLTSHSFSIYFIRNFSLGFDSVAKIHEATRGNQTKRYIVVP